LHAGPFHDRIFPRPSSQSLTCGARWSTCASSRLFRSVTNAPRRLRSRQDHVAFAAAHTLRNTPPSPPHAQELVIMASSLATHQFAGASAQFKCVARASFRARECGDFHAGIAPATRFSARAPPGTRPSAPRALDPRAPRSARSLTNRAVPPPPPGPPPRARTSRPRATSRCVPSSCAFFEIFGDARGLGKKTRSRRRAGCGARSSRTRVRAAARAPGRRPGEYARALVAFPARSDARRPRVPPSTTASRGSNAPPSVDAPPRQVDGALFFEPRTRQLDVLPL
jgi:hypothetical protein